MPADQPRRPRETLRCSDDDTAAGTPYHFDFDGGTLDANILVLEESEIPDQKDIAFYLYEDDDTRCEVRDSEDYLKYTAEAIRNAGDAYNALMNEDFEKFIVEGVQAIIALKEIVEGGDEFVGLIALDHDIDQTVREFIGPDDDLNVTIQADLVFDTRTATGEKTD